MEAAILRNAAVASPIVRDPGSWLYLIAGFGLTLPATLHAALTSWPDGYSARRAALQA